MEWVQNERGIIVDAQDAWLFDFTWSINRFGYAWRNVVFKYGGEGTRVRRCAFMHHCIMGQPIWEDEEIDHINRNTLDNRRNNLRYVNRYIQCQNHGKVIDAKHIDFNKGKWRLRMRRNDIIHTQLFSSYDEAAAERDMWLAEEHV